MRKSYLSLIFFNMCFSIGAFNLSSVISNKVMDFFGSPVKNVTQNLSNILDKAEILVQKNEDALKSYINFYNSLSDKNSIITSSIKNSMQTLNDIQEIKKNIDNIVQAMDNIISKIPGQAETREGIVQVQNRLDTLEIEIKNNLMPDYVLLLSKLEF